ARHLRHDDAARRRQRREHDRHLVADAARAVLADLHAGDVRQVHPVARVDHRVGQPRRLVDGHAAEHDGHQQRRGLVSGSVPRLTPLTKKSISSRDSVPPSRFFAITSTARMKTAFYSIILFGQMTQATLSPELTRQSIALARALSAAARNWTLYPPEHPTVSASVKRLSETISQTVAGAAFTFGVTPETLLVAGYPLPDDQAVAETARLLHDHDLLQVTFLGDPEAPALHALLTLLSRNPEELRASGGPAKAWNAAPHTSIAIDQIDYEKILEDRDIDYDVERRDDIWRSVVNAIVEGQTTFDSVQQQRLLDIAGNAFEIKELAAAVSAPKCNIDGSPMITTQAAIVLATFRHLASIVTVMDPEKLPQVMRNVAAATTALDPHVVMQIMQTDEGMQETPIVTRLAQSFDDEKVAELLATALSKDGKATARLARIFDTIAPDDERKQRVLRMTK